MLRAQTIFTVALAGTMSCDAALALEAVTVTPLYEKTETGSGKPIVLPQKDIRVIVSTFDIAPGATLPIHKHPFARYAVVQSGSLKVVNAATNESKVYKAGDFVVEMIDEWHRAENVGADAVKLLVIDQVEGTAANTVLKDH
jgi:quercetin dioxygenase-like cupin family protein